MPVRQGHRRPVGRSESPPGAPGRTETLPEDDEDVEPESLPTVVVEVETLESNEVELSPEQNVEVEAGETVEASQDQQPDSVEQYDDEGFEKDTDEGDDETGSVTSTDNR